MSTEKPTPRLDALMLRLHRHLERAERGVKAGLVRYLDVRPHMLSEWLAGTKPSAENALGIQEWLKKNVTARKLLPLHSRRTRPGRGSESG